MQELQFWRFFYKLEPLSRNELTTTSLIKSCSHRKKLLIANTDLVENRRFCFNDFRLGGAQTLQKRREKDKWYGLPCKKKYNLLLRSASSTSLSFFSWLSFDCTSTTSCCSWRILKGKHEPTSTWKPKTIKVYLRTRAAWAHRQQILWGSNSYYYVCKQNPFNSSSGVSWVLVYILVKPT